MKEYVWNIIGLCVLGSLYVWSREKTVLFKHSIPCEDDDYFLFYLNIQTVLILFVQVLHLWDFWDSL